LIIDDMGKKQLPMHSGEYLFEIIMRRYETRSTIMTSNPPLENWGELVGDIPAPPRSSIGSPHHAEWITISGRSRISPGHGQRRRNQSLRARFTTSQSALRLETPDPQKEPTKLRRTVHQFTGRTTIMEQTNSGPSSLLRFPR
jgi:hypothetical protein